MRKTLLYLVLLVLFLASCSSTRPEPVITPTASEIKVTSTPVITRGPTATSAPASETTAEPTFPALPPPNIQEAHLTEIDMLDETSGWAWAVDRAYKPYWLHTSDGGLTWEDISPEKAPLFGSFSSFVLDGQTAWIVLAEEELARTSDGGQTWDVINRNLKDELVWPFRDWYKLKFADANRGWLVAGYTAAGAHEIFYETLDGGVTWNTANFETLPSGYVRENSPSEIAFWIDTDVIYYDSERFILAPGDQEGVLEIFLSTDWGRSWKTVQLPSSLPEQPFNVYDRKVRAPVFFDPKNGVLAVTLWDGNANATQLSIYRTRDGGVTWSLVGGPVALTDTFIEGNADIPFLSPQDAVLLCGTKLCATHDGGNSWQTFEFGVAIPAEAESTNFRLDFIDPATGWAVIDIYGSAGLSLGSHLLKTKDGGKTWTELLPVINP